MITEAQVKWIKEQSKTPEGQLWIEFIASYVDMLYNVRGIPIDQVASRQQAAEHLEKIVELSQDREPVARKNEYL